LPEALENTVRITEQCEEYELTNDKYLPRFDTQRHSATQLLRHLTYTGARQRYKGLNSRTKERLDYELSIIEQLGFADYFLVVWDVGREAKQRGIRYAGRGSAADSAVAYCLSITDVDAIARDLSFERLINPEGGNNLPDIDIDFNVRYRDNITAYVTEKYREDNVATVCTFQTYYARGVSAILPRLWGFPRKRLIG